MSVRYVSSFLVAWLRAAPRANYIRHLQSETFNIALDARVSDYDNHGSHEVLDAIVTQTKYAGELIQKLVKIVEQSALTVMYLVVVFYLVPWLTIVAGGILGGYFLGVRYVMESGFSVGGRVAKPNERVQTSV